jgi:starch synthase
MADLTPLKILMLGAEAAPFTRAGELGETIPPLAAALRSLGHEPRIILPRYYFIDRTRLDLVLESVGLDFNGEHAPFGLYSAAIPDSDIPALFIEYEAFFGRDGVYGLDDGQDFPDNTARFAYFCRAAFAACQAIGWIPDIVHAHDWPAAAAVAYLDDELRWGAFGATAPLFTIHDIAWQGLMPAEQFRILGLSPEEFRPGSFEFFGRLNLMQGALRHTPLVSTISPSYASDILTERFGFGMEGILRERRSDLHGILNGLDYQRWDPATDPRLARNYDSGRMAGRTACKLSLQQALGLETGEDKILIAMIARLDGLRGAVELMAPPCLPRLLDETGLQLIVIGSGEPWPMREMRRLAETHPNLIYREWCPVDYLPQVLSAADFLLAPCIYEPSALVTLMAMRYGAVPLASQAGALRDVVRHHPGHPDMDTGLPVEAPVSPDSIREAVLRAMDLRRDTGSYLAIQNRAMGQRFTWDDCAAAYLMLYRTTSERRRSGLPARQAT